MTAIESWVVLTIAAVVVIGARWLLLRRPVDQPLPDVDPHALAAIAGGPRRLATVVIVEMVRAGQLKVEHTGLRVVHGNDAVTDPLRLAVLSGFHDNRVHHRLLWHARRRPEMRAWEHPLREAGLVATPGTRLFARLVPVPLLITTALLEAGFILQPGLLASLSGAFLAPLNIALFITSIVMLVRTPHATPLGRTLLRRARRRMRGTENPPESLAIALNGKLAVDNEALRTALFGVEPSGD